MKRAIPLALGALLFASLLGASSSDPGKETLRHGFQLLCFQPVSWN